MQYVEFYKLKEEGKQEVIAKCYLKDDGFVSYQGPEMLAKNLEKEGIKDYKNEGRRLYFKDGLEFLEQLRFNFTSGYLNASEIKED